jgi:hypothetical protein
MHLLSNEALRESLNGEMTGLSKEDFTAVP